MDKKCFIIIPIGDSEGYTSGHFNRVYEHIIKPACILSGFKPIRANDILSTNYIAIDIIKNILNCDMAICDLSSKNPNVLYELGIRQAFNLPVTLIKDSKTSRIFDIQGFRDIEYDESLRIDTVNETRDKLSEILKNTFENNNDGINSLIGLLGIEPAKISNKTEISVDTELILNSIKEIDKRINKIEEQITPVDNKQEGNISLKTNKVNQLIKKIENFKKGDKVKHSVFGPGVIIDLSNDEPYQRRATIKFADGELKRIVLRYADLMHLPK